MSHSGFRDLVSPLAAAWMACVWVASPAWAADRPAALSREELSHQVDQVSVQLKNAEDNLRVVETQYSERPEATGEEQTLQRYSDGEIQYLLGDFRTASVLFYDLVSDAAFKQTERYPNALYYLADSLYQQGNYIGSRLYLRELLSLNSPHYRDAVQRYLDICGKLNEFSGIEVFIKKERELSGGELPEDVAYVYGKWFFKRRDLSKDERLKKADEVFGRLAGSPQSPFRLQAKYFLGVSEVERGNYTAAIARFREVVQDKASTDRELKVKELANLSLGRVLFETGKYDEAIDRYQEIPRESDYFPDSIYEMAWVKVKKNDFEGAKNATELLSLVAPDSILKPESDILQAHLYLKLHQYSDATETYNSVINTYAPVRDELDALLNVNKDPVAYFDTLLKRNEHNLDVNALLPPAAVKWATTQQDVNRAMHVVGDLESGRHGVDDGHQIAERILKALEDRGLEAFPALQDGYTRADSVDSALTQSQQSLINIEAQLAEESQTPNERQQLAALRAQMVDLQRRFASLPTNEKERLARKGRMQDRVAGIDREVFRLEYELQSMTAMLTAVQKWATDTRGQRRNTADDEKIFSGRIVQERKAVEGLQGEVKDLRQRLQVERDNAEAVVSGEDVIRTQLDSMLKWEHQLIAQSESRLSPEAQLVSHRAHELEERITADKQRTDAAKNVLRNQVAHRGEIIREKVLGEQGLLTGYGKDVDGVSGDARNLVGRIAFDSFRRIRQQFYDLVLKADVGVVDVAFTRKQDQTGEIQKVSAQKDRELRSLDEEFKEVLKDVD